MKSWTFSLMAMAYSCTLLCGITEAQKKEEMIRDLEVIRHTYNIVYAPFQLKKELFGYEWEEAFEQAKNQVNSTPRITVKEFHQIVRKFLGSLKDYHVQANFYSTEYATLPFTIKEAENRYFIEWIDPQRFPFSLYGPNEGDELLGFGGRPIQEVIEQIIAGKGRQSNPQTDKGEAAENLTYRSGRSGDIVPRGPVNIITRCSKTEMISSIDLMWNYFYEKVTHPHDFSETWFAPLAYGDFPLELPKNLMEHPLFNGRVRNRLVQGQIGATESFVPPLGEKIWDSSDSLEDSVSEYESIEMESDSDDERTLWNAYIYLHPEGYKVGYIRIPDYSNLDDELEFGKIIHFMNKKTHALVIDQLHNPGGSVDILYQLLSMLTDKPLKVPTYRKKLDYAYVNALQNYLAKLIYDRSYFDQFNYARTQEKQFDYQKNLFESSFCETMIAEWNAGKVITSPIHLLGYRHVNPHPLYRYTKPMIVLIDELDYSCADFFPAILQDNQRAVLFGTRTAGAGGTVRSFNFHNSSGIVSCSFTDSVIERENHLYIENLGVSPDIQYSLTAEDVQYGYRGYKEALNNSIKDLLRGNS